MVFIEINDILDQLKQDNLSLREQLLVANQCIQILTEFKFFLDSIRDKFESNFDKKVISSLSQLDAKYQSIVNCVPNEDKREVKVQRTQLKPLCYSYSCDWPGCHFSTNRKSRLSAHNNYHTGLRPFQCNKCQKSFVGKESLSTHFKSHFKPIVVKLNPNLKKRKLKKVLKSEKPFKCEKCLYCTQTRQALRQHLMTHFERNLKCNECEKLFKNNKQLKNHLISHSIDPPFKCGQCSAAFRTNKTLKIHLSKHNNSLNELVCDWPGCEFKSVYNWIINRHKLVHTGEKPFKCQWPSCESSFRRSHYLKQHLLKHTGEKPFSCIECEKSFQSKQSLKSHQKIHKMH